MAVTVRVVSDPSGLDALREAWEQLTAAGAGDPLFGSFSWNQIWWRHYHALGELRLLVAEQDGAVVGILPLFLAERNFTDVEVDMIGPLRMVLPGKFAKLRQLAFLGSGEICSDHLQPLVRPGLEHEVVESLLAFLAGRHDWHLLDLCDMCADSPSVQALREQLPKFFSARRERFRYQAPYAPLAPTYEEYLDTLSKKSRYNARKKLKQLRIYHQVEHRYHSDPATLDRAMDTFIELHRLRWEAEGLPGVFVNERFIGFHREMSAEGLRRGWLRLGTLLVDGAPLFVTYTYHAGRRAYLYQQGGAPDWQNFNLGYVALGFDIEEAIACGCTIYDILRGEAEYKLHWAKERRELIEVQAARPGLRGRLFMLHSTVNTDAQWRSKLKKLMGKK